jgi:hypothetical protein
MAIWDFWTTKKSFFVHGFLDDANVPTGNRRLDLVPDDVYVTVWMKQMHLVNVRKGFKKFYGALHSDVGLIHANKDEVSFTHVISPPELQDKDASGYDNTIQVNQRLMGPTPYRGGHIKLNAALLAIQAQDLLKPYLDVLTGLAEAAGVSYVAVAKPFLEPLRQGIDLLSGSGDAIEIYLVSNLKPAQSGAYVVMRADAEAVSLDSLKVDDQFRLVSSSGSLMRDHPYIVITIESSDRRDDWRAVPDLGPSYEQLADALRKNSPPEIESSWSYFRRLVQLSDDLIDKDRQRLIQQVEAIKDEVMAPAKTGGGIETSVRSWGELEIYA